MIKFIEIDFVYKINFIFLISLQNIIYFNNQYMFFKDSEINIMIKLFNLNFLIDLKYD